MESFLSRYRNLSILLLLLGGQLLLLAYQVKTGEDVRLIRVWAVTAVTPVARAIEYVRGGATAAWENIFVLGDASIAGAMPKSAFAANSQAKVVAMTVRGELANARVFPARYANTCWSIINTDDTVKVGGRYEPKDGKITEVEGFVSKTGESPDIRKQTSEENMGWYSGIVADIFS